MIGKNSGVFFLSLITRHRKGNGQFFLKNFFKAVPHKANLVGTALRLPE